MAIVYDPQTTYRYFIFRLSKAGNTVRITTLSGFAHYIFNQDDTMVIIEPGADIPRALDPDTFKTISEAYGSDIHKLLENISFTSVADHKELQAYQDIINTVQFANGPYILRAHLGGGGFGTVFLALGSPNTPQMFAVKFLTAKDMINSIENEASVIGNVTSMKGCLPYVCYVEHGQAEDGTWILITQYISGVNLDVFTRNPLYEQIVTEDNVFQMIITIAGKVVELHSLDPPIYHRDIKGSNIIIFPTETGNFNLRIIDFGAATIGLINDIVGTQGFMPVAAEYERMIKNKKYYLVDMYALARLLLNLYFSIPDERMTAQTSLFVQRLSDAATKGPFNNRLSSVAEFQNLLVLYIEGKSSGRFDASLSPYLS